MDKGSPLGNLLLGVLKGMALHGGMTDGDLGALAGDAFHRHGALPSKKQHQPLPDVGNANVLPLDIRGIQFFPDFPQPFRLNPRPVVRNGENQKAVFKPAADGQLPVLFRILEPMQHAVFHKRLEHQFSAWPVIIIRIKIDPIVKCSFQSLLL